MNTSSLGFILQLSAIFLLIALTESGIHHFGKCTLVTPDVPCNSQFVKFYLFTRSNLEVPEYIEVTPEKDNLTNSKYNDELPTKIIIHGYNADMNLDVLVNLRNEYLKKYDINVLVVDWSSLVPSPCYLTAAYNVRFSGGCLARVIQILQSRVGELDLHVIGFSLGAHLAANAAPKLSPYIIPRVTGLDPALPLFAFGFIANKLDSNDAAFVDIIHTNSFVQGQIKPEGHVDFYMNGGISQPGCPSSNPFACSHARAVEYFAESINTKIGFWGWKCSSFIYYFTDHCKMVLPYVLMGESINHTVRGTFSIDTNDHAPYALGKKIEKPYVILTPTATAPVSYAVVTLVTFN